MNSEHIVACMNAYFSDGSESVNANTNANEYIIIIVYMCIWLHLQWNALCWMNARGRKK